MRQIILGLAILSASFWPSFALMQVQGPQSTPSRHHFMFIDMEFILTLELVRPGVPIFNFINLGKGTLQLQAADIRIICGIKLFRPNLFDVETSNRRDPLRVGAMKVHPHSSFGVTLKGNMENVAEIDRVTVELGPDRYELQSISLQDFETLSRKIAQLSLISPDIREDFRVLELKPLGMRKEIPK